MTNDRPVPYVGVSGVVTPTQQDTLVAIAAAAGLTPTRRLLLGVKATHKTQYDSIANKYGPQWYPVGDAFIDALSPATETTSTFNVAQVYLDIDHVGDPGYRRDFMNTIMARGAKWLHGIQFDMLPWHTDPAIAGFLSDLKATNPALALLVQCHQPAMDALGPAGAARALSNLGPCVDYVLFDASHGTGTRMDVEKLSTFVDAAYSEPGLDRVGVAVAGGLTATAVTDDLPVLLSRFPDVSWDAEGGLHPFAPDGTRPLDMDRVADYLAASASLTATERRR